METKKELKKNYVSACCTSSFRICYKDCVEGEYYICDKCGSDCCLTKFKCDIARCKKSYRAENELYKQKHKGCNEGAK